MNLKHYSFYLTFKKYPKYLGRSYGKNKADAFETLKLIRGFSNTLKLGKKVKGYTSK